MDGGDVEKLVQNQCDQFNYYESMGDNGKTYTKTDHDLTMMILIETMDNLHQW